EAGHPPPAAGSDHHDTAEAAAPVAMAPVAVMPTLASTAGGSFGRNDRRGTDRDHGGTSENRPTDPEALLCLSGCVLTSWLRRRANGPVGSTARRFVRLKSSSS